jgi:hypothetical protein
MNSLYSGNQCSTILRNRETNRQCFDPLLGYTHRRGAGMKDNPARLREVGGGAAAPIHFWRARAILNHPHLPTSTSKRTNTLV